VRRPMALEFITDELRIYCDHEHCKKSLIISHYSQLDLNEIISEIQHQINIHGWNKSKYGHDYKYHCPSHQNLIQ
jgi:hypothetical protein